MDRQGSNRSGVNKVGQNFTHFISASITGDGDLELIRKYQEKLEGVPDIGKAKNPKKMHVTLGCLHVDEGEVEETEQKFRRIGEKFTDVTGAGPFFINFRGLVMGDGSETLFMKVHLGREIMEVLRSIIEDELMEKLTDLRFCQM